jgi:hypothetical protein
MANVDAVVTVAGESDGVKKMANVPKEHGEEKKEVAPASTTGAVGPDGQPVRYPLLWVWLCVGESLSCCAVMTLCMRTIAAGACPQLA